MSETAHNPHPRISRRKNEGAHTTAAQLKNFNDRLAVRITNAVGTMWCAYAFTALALISLPAALNGGTGPLISWIAQTFLQLVLLSIIMVGQKVAAAASDKQALQTFNDAEALLEMTDTVHRLLIENNAATKEIRELLATRA